MKDKTVNKFFAVFFGIMSICIGAMTLGVTIEMVSKPRYPIWVYGVSGVLLIIGCLSTTFISILSWTESQERD